MFGHPDNSSPAEIAAKFVNHTDRPLFLTGKAGTGKTTFLRNIIRSTHKKAVIVAPTGIAAINAAGVTIHSLFQLPFGMFIPNPSVNISLQNIAYSTPKSLAKQLNLNAVKRQILIDLELLIIDEVSMLRADLLDAMDWVLRMVRKNGNEAFGGVQVLFIGDLHQLPPVVKNNEWQVLSEFYKSIYFFDALVLKNMPPIYIELDKIYRQSDSTFINLLNNLRNNQVKNEDLELLKKYYKADFKPQLNDHYITLTTHNAKADSINRHFLEDIPTSAYLYSAEITNDFPESAFPIDKLLEFKVGAQVMFTKNDPSGEQRFFNGKIGVVKRLSFSGIDVETEEGTTISVEKFTWENIRYTTDAVSNELKEEVAGTFIQYPLKLAWAITIHKSQGLTFDKAIIDIGSAFVPGQIYVALSRLRSLDGLVLTSQVPSSGIRIDQHVSYFTNNKVSFEELQQKISLERKDFMLQYLLRNYDLDYLDKEFYAHSQTYNKLESRSSKQTHEAWFVSLSNVIKELKKPADIFRKQIQRLFNDFDSILILERLHAAENYFIPVLENVSKEIFEELLVIKDKKGNALYGKELFDLERKIFEQIKKIKKTTGLLNAFFKGEEFTKEAASDCSKVSFRTNYLEQLQTNRMDVNSKDQFFKKKKIKIEKIDTKVVSLDLFKKGKTVLEISQERKMTVATIEGHLSHFIVKKELDATQLLSRKALDAISEAIESEKTTSITVLRKYLLDKYSFGEIKIGMAAHFAELQ